MTEGFKCRNNPARDGKRSRGRSPWKSLAHLHHAPSATRAADGPTCRSIPQSRGGHHHPIPMTTWTTLSHSKARSRPDRHTSPCAARHARRRSWPALGRFLAAAGRVKFDRGQATLKAVWMTLAYYASLGEARECFATVTTLADRALVTGRTVRRCVQALIDRGLIQTDHRSAGNAPTTWTIRAFSPGQDVRVTRTGCPGDPDRMSGEVRNVGSASKKQKLHQLANKQQPDGAHAPPAAARKKSPQKTEKTQALAPAKTEMGETQGGTTDKQIGFLKLLADRVGADYAEDIWRAADRKRLQTQIAAAKPFKKGNHTHAAREEVIFRIGVENKIGYKEGVQRCECGAGAVGDRGPCWRRDHSVAVGAVWLPRRLPCGVRHARRANDGR